MIKNGLHPDIRRTEVAGLRTLSIVFIVFFLLAPETFKGGFLGFDSLLLASGYIFFYLKENCEKEQNFMSFFLKRSYIFLQRVLPSLIAIGVLGVVLGRVLMNSGDFGEYGLDALFSLLFLGNFWSYIQYEHFTQGSLNSSIFHLWFLGVYVQINLLCFFFLFLSKKFRFSISLFFFVVMIFSFSLCFLWSSSHPFFNFYSPVNRVWEFFVGYFLAFLMEKKEKINEYFFVMYEAAFQKEISVFRKNKFFLYAFRVIVVFCFLCSFFLVVTTKMDEVYIGSEGVFFVFLSGLFLVAMRGDKLFFSFVSSKLVSWVSKNSFNIYLWSFFIFSYQISFEEFFDKVVLEFIFFSLFFTIIFAVVFSNRVVLFLNRFGGKSRTPFILLFSFLSISFVNYSIFHFEGFDRTKPGNIEWDSFDHKVSVKGNTLCASREIPGYDHIYGCEFGDLSSEKTVILYGDSHADAISDELKVTFERNGVKGLRVWVSNCEPVPSLRMVGSSVSFDGCQRSFSSLLKLISDRNADIIPVARWSFRLYPIPGYIDSLEASNSEGGREIEVYREFEAVSVIENGNNFENKKSALESFISSLLSTNQKVFLIYPIPEIAWSISKLNYDYYQKTGSLLGEISIPYADFLSRNKFVLDVFDSFASNDNLIEIKTQNIFCNTFIKNRCVAQFDTVPYYLDDNNLSDQGAKLVIDAIMSEM